MADGSDRASFEETVLSDLDLRLCQGLELIFHPGYWVDNESPAVFPPQAIGTSPPGGFLLSVNGAPVAWTDPPGASLDWIG